MTRVLRRDRDTTRPGEASDVSGIENRVIVSRRGAFAKKSSSRVTDIFSFGTLSSVKAVSFGRFCHGRCGSTPAKPNLHNDDKSPLKSSGLRAGRDPQSRWIAKSLRRGIGQEKCFVSFRRKL